MNENYEDYVRRAAESVFGNKIGGIKYIGGGFYARVFEVGLRISPFAVVVKLHLLSNAAEKECRQIEFLKRRAKIKMPEIYAFIQKAATQEYDAIVMEKIPGKRIDRCKVIPKKYRAELAAQIVDNLIGWHAVTNETFGEIGGRQFATWKEYLRVIIDEIRLSFKACQKDNPEIIALYNEIKTIGAELDTVVPDGIKAALIHGEYNTRNIFKSKNKITGIVDPLSAGFADREFALHQLDVLNGGKLGLLDLYKSKVKLSENFEKKSAFYKLFLELRHHLSVLSLDEAHILKIKKLIEEYKSLPLG
ncbi:MAG: phosphotransferase [Clostridiales bacterium]|jgi:fructosamine-3-kinase|nr:phosphotransferase [Clostridiales bacterium]